VNPTRHAAQYFGRIKRMFGITEEMYNEMLREQEGVCYICHQPDKDNRRLSVDHDRRMEGYLPVKIVRHLLCGHCNRGLGMFRDDPEVLRRAADYIYACD